MYRSENLWRAASADAGGILLLRLAAPLGWGKRSNDRYDLSVILLALSFENLGNGSTFHSQECGNFKGAFASAGEGHDCEAFGFGSLADWGSGRALGARNAA